ncbi:MAG TPA: XdhC family protein [Gaiellaceae bacterium]|jgi:xanthine dehydrogenase accessory factor
MDPVHAKAEEWRAAGEDVALATVIATRRSAPRPAGAKLAVTATGHLFGSVSGGCVEADVAERARAVLAGAPPELVTYGIADDEAWSVGLPCGGEIDVFVEPYPGAPPFERGMSYVRLAGDRAGERWTEEGVHGQTHLEGEVFAESVAPPPRLLIVGAGDIAEALCRIAATLGWRTAVLEPRRALHELVPSAGELIDAWPDEVGGLVDDETAVVSLVHEERLDLPALRAALDGGAFYVGALGSKRAQDRRREALGADADRIHGPVGLDLGAEGPAEIALAIAAELLAAVRKGEAPAGAPPRQTVESR